MIQIVEKNSLGDIQIRKLVQRGLAQVDYSKTFTAYVDTDFLAKIIEFSLASIEKQDQGLIYLSVYTINNAFLRSNLDCEAFWDDSPIFSDYLRTLLQFFDELRTSDYDELAIDIFYKWACIADLERTDMALKIIKKMINIIFQSEKFKHKILCILAALSRNFAQLMFDQMLIKWIFTILLTEGREETLYIINNMFKRANREFHVYCSITLNQMTNSIHNHQNSSIA